MSRDKFLSVNVHDDFNKKKSKLVTGPTASLLKTNDSERRLDKNKRISLVTGLLGDSRDANHILTSYKKMIRVMPDEFDLNKIDKFREEVKLNLA